MSTFSTGVALSALSGVVNAALPTIDKDINETQRFNRMPGNMLLIDGAEEQDTTGNIYGWNIRVREAAGSTQALRAFQATQYQVGYYTERFTVPFRDKTNTAFAFDRLEISRNRAAPNRIYDLLKERRSAQLENIANVNEIEVFGAPFDQNDDSAIFGLECWLRRSMASDGAFVALPDGGYNGTYWRGTGNATPIAILGGQDTAQLALERARNYVMTVGNTYVDTTLLDAVKRCINETMFEMVPGLTGKSGPSMGGDDALIFWDPEYDDQYDSFLAAGPDPRYRSGGGDYYPGKKRTLWGAQLVRTPALRNKADRPIFGLRRSMLQVIKGRGMWMVDGDGVVPGAHNVVYKPRDYTWQMICRDFRKGGFRIHSTFTTGS